MTDKEMAREYALTRQKRLHLSQRETNLLQLAYLHGLEEGKGMKWHNLRSDPCNLPKKVDDYITNIGVLTYDHYGNGIHKWHTPFCEACDYGDEVDDNEIIAWCEIPKYEEE